MATNGTSSAIPFLINGESYHPQKSFDVISPRTGKTIHQCGSASVEDAESAVSAAAAAFKTWRHTTPAYRRDIFLKAAEIAESRRAELIQYLRDETGADEGWGEFNITTAISFMKDVAGRIASLEGSYPRTQDNNVGAIVMREPYGVVLSIAAWNAAYILGSRSLLFPLAAGNTVVFKTSESAPKSMWALASIFHEAGLPKGVINTIAHEPSAAASITSSLIANPHVRKINFTGSTNVGRIIGKLAGEQLKPVVLELGGKAPAIVWEDADLDIAAKHCTLGAFLNAGQVCMSTERILVHKSIKDKFVAKFQEYINNIFPSDKPAPTLIAATPVEKNKKLVQDATSKGASILIGDANATEENERMMRPVVLGGVTKEMDIYQTESFGPTVSLIEIETEEEALELANDTPYGLSSSVFTEDLRRGLRFARQIEAGAVHINSMSPHDEAALPHGGAKASGHGRFNTLSGIEEWTWTKNVTFLQ